MIPARAMVFFIPEIRTKDGNFVLRFVFDVSVGTQEKAREDPACCAAHGDAEAQAPTHGDSATGAPAGLITTPLDRGEVYPNIHNPNSFSTRFSGRITHVHGRPRPHVLA